VIDDLKKVAKKVRRELLCKKHHKKLN
uniref:Guentherin n=1 Tax=Sylvirana guentheri TaxID=110109 RepID=GUEN_SYLGU|nr:RecName: Full=Guentherin; AltName: Full=AMP-3 [Sylvirana guentheri]